MGYDYLALGGTVPLKIEQIRRALAAVRDVMPSHVRLHVLGFGKIEHLADLKMYGVTSFDTTSPLVRAFKDARKNYWMRSPSGDLSYYTAIRIPQATENNRLKQKALEGSVNQEAIRLLEDAALSAVRQHALRELDLESALEAVMAYWGKIELGRRGFSFTASWIACAPTHRLMPEHLAIAPGSPANAGSAGRVVWKRLFLETQTETSGGECIIFTFSTTTWSTSMRKWHD